MRIACCNRKAVLPVFLVPMVMMAMMGRRAAPAAPAVPRWLLVAARARVLVAVMVVKVAQEV